MPALDLALGRPDEWAQLAELGYAFVLSALIGLERELHQKSAGVRTYTIVGLGSALFMLVSKYGFDDVLAPGLVTVDPSRVAAQIVSGLGFIGAGIIFVRRDSVRGLTTAASVWLTAAVGAAAAAGLVAFATAATAAYFVAILGLPPIARFARARLGRRPGTIRVQYVEGTGLLRGIIAAVTGTGLSVTDLDTLHLPEDKDGRRRVEVSLQLAGKQDVVGLVGALAEIDGVLEVSTDDREA
jgi:putative Mg2+ transporter-C (MgtC) family protein